MCTVLVAIGLLGSPQQADAALSDTDRMFTLPGKIFTSDPSLDRDRDYLVDDYENMLADAWRPVFIFDEEEESLRANEPVTLFQVRPVGNSLATTPWHISINWAFLWANDGGYTAGCGGADWHNGDSQGSNYDLVSWDGVHWSLDSLDLWTAGRKWANAGRIQWSGPRSTYWGKLDPRPSPVVYASEGKHHQYIDNHDCEDHDKSDFCDEDCGGGAVRYANLTPQGTFTNVGESWSHPQDKGTNNPFVNDLSFLGYADELVWWANTLCTCNGVTSECFTGGYGLSWESDGGAFGSCAIPTAIKNMFDNSPLPVAASMCGDHASGDQDLDGFGGFCDNCPLVANPSQADLDHDGRGDACDNCVDVPNSKQEDMDKNGVGNACDSDIDGDLVPNATDNCPLFPNSDQLNQDSDTFGDICDNCDLIKNDDQSDRDCDGLGDACDRRKPDLNGDEDGGFSTLTDIPDPFDNGCYGPNIPRIYDPFWELKNPSLPIVNPADLLSMPETFVRLTERRSSSSELWNQAAPKSSDNSRINSLLGRAK